MLITFLINVHFTCQLNIPGFLKWKSTGIDFGLLKSFVWLFTVMLKAVSASSTYLDFA